MRFRKGDLIIYMDWNRKQTKKVRKFGLITGTPNDWWCIDGCVDVYVPEDIGHIISMNDIISFVPRELIEDFWRFI